MRVRSISVALNEDYFRCTGVCLDTIYKPFSKDYIYWEEDYRSQGDYILMKELGRDYPRKKVEHMRIKISNLEGKEVKRVKRLAPLLFTSRMLKHVRFRPKSIVIEVTNELSTFQVAMLYQTLRYPLELPEGVQICIDNVVRTTKPRQAKRLMRAWFGGSSNSMHTLKTGEVSFSPVACFLYKHWYKLQVSPKNSTYYIRPALEAFNDWEGVKGKVWSLMEKLGPLEKYNLDFLFRNIANPYARASARAGDKWALSYINKLNHYKPNILCSKARPEKLMALHAKAHETGCVLFNDNIKEMEVFLEKKSHTHPE